MAAKPPLAKTKAPASRAHPLMNSSFTTEAVLCTNIPSTIKLCEFSTVKS